MAKSSHTGGERGIVPDWRAIGITRRLEVQDLDLVPVEMVRPKLLIRVEAVDSLAERVEISQRRPDRGLRVRL
jgi:hypothetical protein